MQLRRGRRTCEVNPRAWVAPLRIVEARPLPPIADTWTGKGPQAVGGTSCPQARRTPVASPGSRPDGGVMKALLLTVLALLMLTPPAYADVDPTGEWPLRPVPEVVAGFDPPSSTWSSGHRGVDLLGLPGQRVHAALAGRVSFVGMIAGKSVVVVDHGDTRTTYEPVTSMLATGDQVSAGDVIGSLALPGSHCFPRACLHWGWIQGDTYLDPLRLVGAGPVRLLPLSGLPVMAPLIPTPYAGWQPLLRLLRPGVQP